MSQTNIETRDYLDAEWIDPSDIEPNDWNPNYMPTRREETLVNSLLDNGWTQHIVVQQDTDTIIDGEQRWRVAQKDGRVAENGDLTPDGVPAGHVPIYRMTASELQSRLATYQHNEATGEHDHDLVGELLNDLDEREMLDEGGERIGYKPGEIDTLLPHGSGESGDASAGEALIDKPWADDDELNTDDSDENESDMEQMSFLITEAEMATLNELIGDAGSARGIYVLCKMAREHDL